jgi:iron(III) transport system ATP-binding protein
LERLYIQSIVHAYGQRRVLDGIDLTVAPGEVVCLLGPSGCGKTTLLRLVAGLEPVQAGQIRAGGREMASTGRHVQPERRGVGFVFQDYALFPHLSVLDNVAFGLTDHSPKTRIERSMSLLETVGMAARAQAFPHMLSGGQQQRVALARALAPEPGIILLDEPFSGLDARLREQLRDDTLHVLKSSKVMALMVTHDSEEAMFMADRIAVMRDGRIVQEGRPHDLYFHPSDPFVADFFGETNHLKGKVTAGTVVTPLGRLPADGLAEGAEIKVRIRPEGLRLVPSASAEALPLATVLAARMLGRGSLVHLALEDASGAHHLHARVAAHFLPNEGETVGVDLDPRLAFLFGE